MSVAAEPRPLRIGDVARVVGVTPRTIRYYEEIGLLGEAGERRSGAHRLYSEGDVERLREIVELRDALGVPLEELRELVEHEDARAALRAEWQRGVDRERGREIMRESLAHIDRQVELVRRRKAELERLEQELAARRRRVRDRLRRLSA